jgi:Tol biopolymer transport system component
LKLAQPEESQINADNYTTKKHEGEIRKQNSIYDISGLKIFVFFVVKKITYATRYGQLNIIDIETKKSHQLAETELKTPNVSPSFSPDGKKVTYAQFRLPKEWDDTDLMIVQSKRIRQSTTVVSFFYESSSTDIKVTVAFETSFS